MGRADASALKLNRRTGDVRGTMKPELPKRLIVTGGASGIGYAFSEHLAQLGHGVVIADLRGAEEAAARLRESGYQAIGVRADVVSEADVAEMAATPGSA